MNTLIYAGVVLAGAVTLMIDAWKNYQYSLDDKPFENYPILNGVRVSMLCTKRERNIGFFLYSLLYLVAYAVILSSAELYQLLEQSGKLKEVVGPSEAIFGPNSDPVDLLDKQYGKPIFISAAIISLLSVGALKPVETTMRSLAHKIAGVPRGVYAEIEKLQRQDYVDFPAKYPNDLTPLHRLFEENMLKEFKEDLEADRIRMLRNALLGIDYLAPTMLGHTRVKHFPISKLAKLNDLSSKLHLQLVELRKMMEHRAKDVRREDVEAAISQNFLDTVALLAVHYLRNNRSMIMPRDIEGQAGNRFFRKTDHKSATVIEKVARTIKRGYRIEHNSLMLGLVAAASIGTWLSYLAVYDWNSKEYRLRPVSLAPLVEQQLTELEVNFPRQSELEACLTEPPRTLEHRDSDLGATARADRKRRMVSENKIEANDQSRFFYWIGNTLSDWTRPSLRFDPPTSLELARMDEADAKRREKAKEGGKTSKRFGDTNEACSYVWKSVLLNKMAERRQLLLNHSFWVVLPTLLSIGLAAVTAILGREVRRDEDSWATDWTLRQIPFMRLFSMSVIPALAAVFGISLGLMLELVVKSGFQVTQNNLIYLFDFNLKFIAMHALVGFTIALSVLTLIDQHDRLYNETTFLASLILAALLLGVYLLVVNVGFPPDAQRPSPEDVFMNISFHTREAILHGLPGAVFVIAFGFFLELSEDPQKDRGWLLSEPFKATWSGIRSAAARGKAWWASRQGSGSAQGGG